MPTKQELQNELTVKGISYNGRDTKTVLEALLLENNNMSEDTQDTQDTQEVHFEEVISNVMNQMVADETPYVEFKVIQAVLEVEDDRDILEYLSKNIKRLAEGAGLIESAEQRKERLATKNAEKEAVEASLKEAIEELDSELPAESDEYTALLNSLAETSGASKAKVRATLKPMYEDMGIDMPKATRVAGVRKEGFGGSDRIIFDWVMANPDATAEEASAFTAGQFDVNENQAPKYVATAMKFLFMQKLILDNISEDAS